MEISLGQYGKMIFEMCLGTNEASMSDHWKSMIALARPHVQALVDLNEKNVGYTITNISKKGRKVLPRRERIKRAMERMMEVDACTLREGDRIFLHKDYDMPHENILNGDTPIKVEIVHGNRIIVEHPQGRRAGVYEIDLGEKVLKVPENWDEDSDCQSEEYWLAKADEFEI